MNESFAIVLAGGGERVIAWQTGVLAGLAASGPDPRSAAAIVGTSAGAIVAARLAAGYDPRADAAALAARTTRSAPDSGAAATFAGLAALWAATPGSDTERRRRIGALALEYTPTTPDALMARVRARIPAAPFPPTLHVAAVDAVSGERVALTAADGVPLARAVAASRAIPTVDPPVRIGRRRLIDGAVGSATNADLALATDATTVVVIASFGLDLWAAALDREVAALEAAGRRVIVLRPSERDQAAMGPDPMSAATAALAVAAGLEAAAA
jgi:NTE family protein